MNALSANFEAPGIQPRARVAVLVDGENISAAFAGQIILQSAGYGDLIIKRVYGNAQKPSGWDAAPGFRTVHSGAGKNATDLLLSVAAMEFMLRNHADVLVIAASNRDYTHLTRHLCETGYKVVVLGEAKSPEAFRKSCTKFIEIALPAKAEQVCPDTLAPVSVKLSSIDKQLLTLMALKNENGGLAIAKLGGHMHTLHKINVSSTPEKTCRAYLMARPNLFTCDPRGPDAKVRLKSVQPRSP